MQKVAHIPSDSTLRVRHQQESIQLICKIKSKIKEFLEEVDSLINDSLSL